MIEDQRIVGFIEVLKSKSFKDRVKSLGGYNFERAGEIVNIN